MTVCYSEPGTDILYPWTVTGDAADLWNKFFSQKFGWRSFTTGKSNSSKKAAYRLTMIIKRNAAWLGGSAKSPMQFLYPQWRIYMIGASVYLEKHGVEDTSVDLGRQLDITMTFWRFQEPSLKHLHVMFNDNLGIDPDEALAADQDRRKRKSEIINGFKDQIHGFLKDAVYLSGSDNERLERALALASQTLDQVRDDLRWESSEALPRVPMEDRHGRMKAAPSAETAGYLEDED